MGKIETLNTESELLQRIDQLKADGLGERDLQVITENRLEDNSLEYTDVKVKNSRGSFSDKLTALFSGESAEERVLTGINVPDENVEEYKNALTDGKILLYIDNDNTDETENFDSSHPKDSQSGNEHYDDTKPFSKENSSASPETSAGVGAGAGAAAASSSNETNNKSDDLQDDKDTNRYGNSIDDENEAHDDVDDHSTASTLAGTSGLGAAGYASNQSEQRENENETFSSDNERDLEELKQRNNNNSKPPYGEADNVKDQRDLTREDESEFTRVHDDNVETERSSLNDERKNVNAQESDDLTRQSDLTSNENRDNADNTNTTAEDEESVRLHEERVNVDKENVETGEASVDKHVVEETEEFDVPVEKEEVTIERRPVNEKVDSDFESNEDDSVHVPLHEERVNVDKENVVSEEIVIKKNKVQDTEHVSENVRREEADINKPDNNKQ